MPDQEPSGLAESERSNTKGAEKMIDAHISLSGPYTYENLMKHVEQAVKKGLSGITILEPTHKFKECKTMYREVCATYPCQKDWFQSVNTASIKDYQKFVETMRKKAFPIEVSFGLEVCYFTQHEPFIRRLKSEFPYDRFVGCIKFIDNVAFAWKEHSFEMLWNKYHSGFLYRRYYEMMNALLTSELFDGVSGFDDIKTLQVPCHFKLFHTYHKLAALLAKYHMYVEDDASLGYQHHHEDHGLAPAFRIICEELGVEILRVSHATRIEEIGIL